MTSSKFLPNRIFIKTMLYCMAKAFEIPRETVIYKGQSE